MALMPSYTYTYKIRFKLDAYPRMGEVVEWTTKSSQNLSNGYITVPTEDGSTNYVPLSSLVDITMKSVLE